MIFCVGKLNKKKAIRIPFFVGSAHMVKQAEKFMQINN